MHADKHRHRIKSQRAPRNQVKSVNGTARPMLNSQSAAVLKTSPSHMPLLKETRRTFISSAVQLLGLEACMITNYCENNYISSGLTSCLPIRAWLRGRRWASEDIIAPGHKTKFTLGCSLKRRSVACRCEAGLKIGPCRVKGQRIHSCLTISKKAETLELFEHSRGRPVAELRGST